MTGKPVKILLIEDDTGDARLLKEALSESNTEHYELVHKQSLAEGLKILDKSSFDIVFLDLGLPDSQGIDSISRILVESSGTPVVVLTGLSDEEVGLQALQAGAQDYLVKGWSDSMVVSRAMRYAIERHKLVNEMTFNSQLLKNLPHAVISTNLDHQIVTWNRQTQNMFGWSEEEALGRNISIIHPEGEEDSRFDNIPENVKNGCWFRECRRVNREGEVFDVLLTSAVIRDEKNRPIGYFGASADITERKKAERALKQIEWLIHREIPEVSEKNILPEGIKSPYRNPVELNTCRLILDSVGEEMLQSIVFEQLRLLETSIAIFEKNGDYALRLIYSPWCRMMDEASFRLCSTDDTEQAMKSGKWLCHQTFWDNAGRLAIDSGQIVDIPSPDGRKVHAVPVFSEHEIIGSIVMSYGDPPGNKGFLRKLSRTLKIDMKQLKETARSYNTRPQFIIEIAKERLLSSAKLIGEIVYRKRVEQRQQFTSKILRMLSTPELERSIIQDILVAIRYFTGLEAVGIRLQKGDDFPYYVTRGFAKDFLKAENCFCTLDKKGKIIRDSEGNPYFECMCGKVLQDKTDPSLPFFTSRGSFWTNSTSELLASTKEKDDKVCTLIRCNSEGYESVALIPLRSQKNTIGLLQLNDKRKNCFSKEMIRFFEDVGDSVAVALKRQKMENALRVSEENYRELYNNAPVGYHELDTEGKIQRINNTETEMFGYKPEEMIGKSIFDFNPPLVRKQYKKGFKLKMAGKKEIVPFEREYIRKDGAHFYCLIEDRLIRDSSGEITGVRSSLQDISSRIVMEEARTLMETAIEQAGEAFLITDVNGVIQYVNPQFEEITGYSYKEVIGKRPNILRSGKQDDSFYKELWKTILAGEIWQGRFVNKKKDGSFYHEEASISPVKDSTGRIVNFVAAKRNVSEQIELENQLRHAQKMESVGVLAGGVAHDFNNILTTIMGFSSLICRDKSLPEKVLKRTGEIEKAAQRGSEITSQLLTFSRKKQPRLENVELNTIVSQTVRMIKAAMGPNITIECKLDESDTMICADSTQIQQVLMNLCINSRDAIENEGLIEVTTSGFMVDKEFITRYLFAKPGEYMIMSVKDNGTGMDQETISHVFEPFYTTKEQGKGTGLGMSIVYGIVKNHGGFVNLYSEPGKGTIIKIYLPKATEKGKEIKETVDKAVLRGDETILIVDDEIMLLNLAEGILQDGGYKTLIAESGQQALEIFAEQHENIDLAVMDIVMPRMSGVEVFKKMKEIDPDVSVIMSSGFNLENEKHLFEEGIKASIPKPYSTELLLSRVRGVLDEVLKKKKRGNK